MFTIYAEVAKICDRHGLRYYVTDGTALGAMRHGGFIPWDDDFDISMPRPDYDEFRKFAPQELPENLKFMDCWNAPEFTMLFGKVLDTRRDVVEGMEKKIGYVLSGGIGIDIFPIEGFPSGLLKKLYVKLVHAVILRRLVFQGEKFKGNTFKGKMHCLSAIVCALLTPWLKTEADLLMALERLVLCSSFDESEYTARTCSQRSIFRRVPLRKEVWGKPTPVEFDGSVVMVPEDCDSYLRNEFYQWDYHEFPPEDKQHPTHSYSEHRSWWLGPL